MVVEARSLQLEYVLSAWTLHGATMPLLGLKPFARHPR